MIIHYKHFENQQKIYTLFREAIRSILFEFQKKKKLGPAKDLGQMHHHLFQKHPPK